jgi:hypothetical protein
MRYSARMSRLLGTLAGWLAGRLGLLLVVLALLLLAGWVRAEWSRLQQARADLPVLEQRLAALREEGEALDRRIAAAEAAWALRREGLARELAGQLAVIDAAVERTEGPWREAVARFTRLEDEAARARREAAAAAARRDRLQREVDWWPWPLDLGKRAELAAAQARAAALEQQARAWELARDRVAPALRDSPLQELLDRRAAASAEASRLQSARAPGTSELERSRELRGRDAALVDRELAQRRAELAADPGQRLLDAVRAALPAALGILLAVTLAPVALKALAYFVVAPLAARLAPVRLPPPAPGAAPPSAGPSAVSIPLAIAPGDELLLHTDFLQSSSERAPKRTRWLLDPALPFTSVAAGLYALTRIGAAGDEPVRVTVSALRDPLGEVAAVTLPVGSAMVVSPRALAGVLKPAAQPLRITRHWRLGSLHAWLTLQLRFLVFHGPCTLVVKGCRGVRAEQGSAAQPRVINQDATLGFSTSLDYRTARCETFVAYLAGRESLFDDVFGGGPGIFLQEELPAGLRGGGPLGRGLNGLLDAGLKAFGI